jgi:hypothetical protein
MFATETHEAITRFLAGRTCEQLEQIARDHDIPLHTMPDGL